MDEILLQYEIGNDLQQILLDSLKKESFYSFRNTISKYGHEISIHKSPKKTESQSNYKTNYMTGLNVNFSLPGNRIPVTFLKLEEFFDNKNYLYSKRILEKVKKRL